MTTHLSLFSCSHPAGRVAVPVSYISDVISHCRSEQSNDHNSVLPVVTPSSQTRGSVLFFELDKVLCFCCSQQLKRKWRIFTFAWVITGWIPIPRGLCETQAIAMREMTQSNFHLAIVWQNPLDGNNLQTRPNSQSCLFPLFAHPSSYRRARTWRRRTPPCERRSSSWRRRPSTCRRCWAVTSPCARAWALRLPSSSSRPTTAATTTSTSQYHTTSTDWRRRKRPLTSPETNTDCVHKCFLFSFLFFFTK